MLPSNQATMSSRDIAELSGNLHKNVMRDIRKMEAAWEKSTGLKFELSVFKDETGRTLPMYQLTKTQCLYVATKFNDEARARLVLRWEKLEGNQLLQINQLVTATTSLVESMNTIAVTMTNYGERLERLEKGGAAPLQRSIKFTPEIIDARNSEYDFVKINNHNVRRIIISDRVFYSINDVHKAIGVSPTLWPKSTSLETHTLRGSAPR
jgi:Rha family phage regulatory protein